MLRVQPSLTSADPLVSRRMCKGARGPVITPFTYAGVLPSKEEIPPAVIAVRRALGRSDEEVEDGNRLGRGSLAMQIAADPARKELAVKRFGSLTLALTMQNTKESLFSLWERVCRQIGLEAIPVTEKSIVEVVAILRASGYKAVTTYVQEAKSRHIKAGYVWDSKLNMFFSDVKRVAKRAQGPATRAEEIKLEWWKTVMTLFGFEPSCLNFSAREPAGGAWVWALATRFVLRETELAGLTLDTNGIRFDFMNKV